MLLLAFLLAPILLSFDLSPRVPPLPLLGRWKEENLGSGADYMKPRTKHVRPLCKIVNNNLSPNPSSVAILANCARFDVFLTFEADIFDVHNVRRSVAQTIFEEAKLWETSGSGGLNAVKKFFDVPQPLPPSLTPSATDGGDITAAIIDHITTIDTPTAIVNYLALAAAGLNNPKNRPFAPFSSRDAHIMLQIKRMMEVSEERCASHRAELTTIFAGIRSK